MNDYETANEKARLKSERELLEDEANMNQWVGQSSRTTKKDQESLAGALSFIKARINIIQASNQ